MLNKTLFTFALFSTFLMAKDTIVNFDETNTSTWHKNATWQLEEENGSTVLSLVKRSDIAYNLCYNPEFTFLNGSVTVKFRANSGHIDQGGGIMWRVQDDKNYYIARFNPLEDNFRFYLVHDGIRDEISSANVHLSKGWHSMKITQEEDTFKGYIDGKVYLEARDKALNRKGSVGVWTKADAMTSFDDLNISISK